MRHPQIYSLKIAITKKCQKLISRVGEKDQKNPFTPEIISIHPRNVLFGQRKSAALRLHLKFKRNMKEKTQKSEKCIREFSTHLTKCKYLCIKCNFLPPKQRCIRILHDALLLMDVLCWITMRSTCE